MQPLAWVSNYLIKRLLTLRLVSVERSFAITEAACIRTSHILHCSPVLPRAIHCVFFSKRSTSIRRVKIVQIFDSALVRMCSRSLHYNGANDKRILPTPVSREGPRYRISTFEGAQLVEYVRFNAALFRWCLHSRCNIKFSVP